MGILFDSIKDTLPKQPGVYIFKDTAGDILYIGKAKNLSSRVRSYFQKGAELTAEKQRMVSLIEKVEFMIVPSNSDALLLEATLVKKFRPPFNIELKDGKNWLFMRITSGDFPKIETVRTVTQDGSRYFGPYTSTRSVRSSMRFLRNFFPYPSCNIIRDGACIEYTMGYAIGPTRNVDQQEYNSIIQEVKLFLEGKQKVLLRRMETEMKEAAQKQQFERASRLRDQLRDLALLLERQQVISPHPYDTDTFTLSRGFDQAVVHLLQVREGKVVGGENFGVSSPLEESNESILSHAVRQYYLESQQFPKEVVIPYDAALLSELSSFLEAVSKKRIKFFSPKKGWRAHLLQISQRNADHFLHTRFPSWQADKREGLSSVRELMQALGLSSLPRRMEAYDISNIQGKEAVGSMVVFEDGVPSKKKYRKFRIQTVFQSDDFAMMQEVLYRRLKHSEDWGLPDLFVIDGGKGQLSAACEILKIKKIDRPIIGLAKRNEEIFFPGKSDSLVLSKDSESLRLLQRIRDEAHRFAIIYHRSRKDASDLRSRLDEIAGIGVKRRKELLKKFGSFAAIKEASVKELSPLVGKKLALRIKGE